MKDSEKIRDQYNAMRELVQKAMASGNPDKVLGCLPGMEFYKVNFLADIAIQLAKLNEHFEMVDASVFGGKSESKEKKVQETGNRTESIRENN